MIIIPGLKPFKPIYFSLLQDYLPLFLNLHSPTTEFQILFIFLPILIKDEQ
jgi:hypothetical protein